VRPCTAAYTNGLRGGLNQGRFDDSDTAHNADTDRQWHHHHHTPALPPSPISQISYRICTNYKVVLGSPGEQLLHLLHNSYATGGRPAKSYLIIENVLSFRCIKAGAVGECKKLQGYCSILLYYRASCRSRNVGLLNRVVHAWLVNGRQNFNLCRPM